MNGLADTDVERSGLRWVPILVLVTLFCACPGLADEPIKIGIIDAFSGPAAAFGEPALMGWKMAVEEVNSTGGIRGRQVVIVTRDDEFTEDKALAVAQDLVLNEGVHFLCGTSSSSCALAVSQVAREHKKIFMVHIARSERITGEKGHRYVFRACPNSTIEGKSGARYAKHRKYLNWYIIGEDYEYGRSIAKSFWQALAELQPKANRLGESWIPLKTDDYSPYIADMKAKRPSAVYVAFGVSGMVRFLKQASKARVLDHTRLFLNLMADPVPIGQLGDETLNENAYGSSSYLWYFPNSPENTEFVQKYAALLKREGVAQQIPPGFAAFGGYCAARFLMEAIRKAGAVETERVVETLEELTITTPIGPITMRGCDHQALTPTYWGRIQNTQSLALPTLLAPQDVAPDRLLPECERSLGQGD